MKQNVRFVYLEYDEYISQLIFRQKRKDDEKNCVHTDRRWMTWAEMIFCCIDNNNGISNNYGEQS